jgi:hypothetical protein
LIWKLDDNGGIYAVRTVVDHIDALTGQRMAWMRDDHGFPVNTPQVCIPNITMVGTATRIGD